MTDSASRHENKGIQSQNKLWMFDKINKIPINIYQEKLEIVNTILKFLDIRKYIYKCNLIISKQVISSTAQGMK